MLAPPNPTKRNAARAGGGVPEKTIRDTEIRPLSDSEPKARKQAHDEFLTREFIQTGHGYCRVTRRWNHLSVDKPTRRWEIGSGWLGAVL